MRQLLFLLLGVTVWGQALGACPADPSTPMLTAPIPGKTGAERVFTREIWDMFVKGTNDVGSAGHACVLGYNFFKFENFIEASKLYPEFGNSGDFDIDRREVAAFLAQNAHETTGGWGTAPCGHRSYGYCYNQELNCEGGGCTGYCQAGDPCTSAGYGFPCVCAAGKTYHGRGPVQLSWNYNYAYASKELLGDEKILLNDPDMVTRDPVFAWRTALWFWMTPQHPKPSNHEVMTGRWEPTQQDKQNGLRGGYGAVTNVINGGLECRARPENDYRVEDRVELYKRLAFLMGVRRCAKLDHSLRCNGMPGFGGAPGPVEGHVISSAECVDDTLPEGPGSPPTQSPTQSPTQAPPTQAPPTQAPPTQAPPTPTQAPPTQAPPTQAPPTQAPTPPATQPPPAGSGSCVRETDCVKNLWCHDAAFDGWCSLNAATCPTPFCKNGGSSPPQTPTTTSAPISTTTSTTSTTTKAITSTTSPPPPSGGGNKCRRNLDCTTNAWCKDQSYDTWCGNQGAAGSCPAPYCILSTVRAVLRR